MTEAEDCLHRLVSFSEIAEMTGVQKATVWRWKSVGTLPEPIGELSGHAVWDREEIIVWAQSTGRTITY